MDQAEGNNNKVAVEPEAECERLRNDLRREHDMYLRALADFDNYRRRVERDREKASNLGKRGLLLSLFDVVDSFDRALPYISAAPPAVAEGVQAIYRRLQDLLEAHQVRPVKAVGEQFDPAVHEAIGTVDSDQYPSGTVAEELQRGYLLGDELLRPARVRVVR